MAQARSFFDRALPIDRDNVDAFVGSARADVVEGVSLFVTDPISAFAAAEAKLAKALSSVPDHARGHMTLGLVHMFTKRAAQGIAECEHALALDRNLANAHAIIGTGKVLIGHPEETEAHVREALRLSPRDTMAYAWMSYAGNAKNSLVVGSRQWHGSAGRSRPTETIRIQFCVGRSPRAAWSLDEAHSAVKAGLAFSPSFSSGRPASAAAPRWRPRRRINPCRVSVFR